MYHIDTSQLSLFLKTREVSETEGELVVELTICGEMHQFSYSAASALHDALCMALHTMDSLQEAGVTYSDSKGEKTKTPKKTRSHLN